MLRLGIAVAVKAPAVAITNIAKEKAMFASRGARAGSFSRPLGRALVS